MSHGHGHDHDEHGHDHAGAGSDSAQAIRAQALEELLIEKGILTPTEVDSYIKTWNHRIGPQLGASIVARAWVDDGFRGRLLNDAISAIAEVGIHPGRLERLEVVANEPGVHNVVCCTLCSCYPWTILGLPPDWYKSPQYRSRIVREPRVVLAEMGLELGPEVEIRVWDSSAEIRYLVLPERPDGTDELNEEQLQDLVSRDSMIGVALPAPAPAPAPGS